MMTFGACSFGLCIGYILYMRNTYKGNPKVYTVIDDNDELVLTKKKSRWE